MTQHQLAVAANVSQSAVCRALKKPAQRAGSARRQIFTYIENEYRSSAPDQGPGEVISAFTRIWDGSPTHTAAVVKVINALDGLRPSKAEER